MRLPLESRYLITGVNAVRIRRRSALCCRDLTAAQATRHPLAPEQPWLRPWSRGLYWDGPKGAVHSLGSTADGAASTAALNWATCPPTPKRAMSHREAELRLIKVTHT